jgi:hypothetical protein
MKKIYFLATIIFLSYSAVYSQINTQEEPISFKTSVPILTKSAKTMKLFASLNMEEIEREGMEDKKISF